MLRLVPPVHSRLFLRLASATGPCCSGRPERAVVRRRQGEKGLVDRLADQVQPRLEAVDEFVDAAGDDLVDVAVVELRPQPPQPLLGQRAKRSRLAARDRQQRVLGADQAEVHRAGKVAVENQELGHLRGRGAAVPLAIHLQRADALQQRHPLVRVDRRAHVGDVGQQQVVLDVEDPRGLVGPLDRHRPGGGSARPRPATSSIRPRLPAASRPA